VLVFQKTFFNVIKPHIAVLAQVGVPKISLFHHKATHRRCCVFVLMPLQPGRHQQLERAVNTKEVILFVNLNPANQKHNSYHNTPHTIFHSHYIKMAASFKTK